jgi:UV DNA damage endonuclease
MINRLGYACVNATLKDKTTNRTMRLTTFQKQGLQLCSKLALQNVKDLIDIINWNEANDIKFFRLSSNVFPWQSRYELEELPDYEEIYKTLKQVGSLVKQYNHRITTHPGQFNVLASPKKSVINRTIRDLRDHAVIMDIMELSNTPYNKINIHVGGAYGDKEKSLNTWIDNFQLLPTNVKNRLTVENDDKENMFSVKDLMYIHENTKIPIVFDYHHHKFNTGDLSEEEAFNLAYSTWNKDIIPVFHVSEPKDTKKPRSHHDYILQKINTYNKPVDIMLECKMKDIGLIKYRKLHESKEK